MMIAEFNAGRVEPPTGHLFFSLLHALTTAQTAIRRHFRTDTLEFTPHTVLVTLVKQVFNRVRVTRGRNVLRSDADLLHITWRCVEGRQECLSGLDRRAEVVLGPAKAFFLKCLFYSTIA